METYGERIAIRRAAALGHFVPGFSFRIMRGCDVLVEVGRGLGRAPHPTFDSCEFRWSVSRAVSMGDDAHVSGLLETNGSVPLRVDWAMASESQLSIVGLREAKIHQNGLVEVMLTDGDHRWVFSTLIDPDLVGDIVRHLALSPTFSAVAEGVYDDGLEVTMVVIAPIPGADVLAVRRSAQEILGETMAHELLYDAAGSAWS